MVLARLLICERAWVLIKADKTPASSNTNFLALYF